MPKIIVPFLFVLLVSCDSQSVEESNLTGVVKNITSCEGGAESVFIIKLGEKDSIMTATLPKEFHTPNLKIQFKTKEKSSVLYCTADKIYPEHLDVYDVISL